jgi:mannose-6-phosphate isomerase-like protein (cupin superfamily)
VGVSGQWRRHSRQGVIGPVAKHPSIMSTRQPHVVHRDAVAAVPCPCGASQRLITRAHSPNVGLHVTRIQCGELHFHQATDEVYYVLEGEGSVKLDADTHAVSPGTAILIPAGVWHRGWGDFTVVVVTQPAFDADDEFVVDETPGDAS